jgi:hypothetical protein
MIICEKCIMDETDPDIIFNEEEHRYFTTCQTTEYHSITKFVSHFHSEFDSIPQAQKYAIKHNAAPVNNKIPKPPNKFFKNDIIVFFFFL